MQENKHNISYCDQLFTQKVIFLQELKFHIYLKVLVLGSSMHK
jgi:hypothetical protein